MSVGIMDNEDAVTCRICGETQVYLTPHLKSHGISYGEYRNRFPDAPTHAGYVSTTEWAWLWRDGPLSEGIVKDHEEFLKSIDDTWLLPNDDYRKEVVDVVCSLERVERFRWTLAAAIVLVLRDVFPHISISDVAEDVDGVSTSELYGEIQRIPGATFPAPSDQFDSLLEYVEDDLGNDLEAVQDRVESFPSRKYGMKPETVVGYAIWQETDYTQSETVDLLEGNVTEVSIRDAKRRFGEDE